MKKILRRVLRAGVLTLALLGIGLAALKWYLDATYFNGYDPTAPLRVEVVEDRELPAFRWTKFYYAGHRGARVPAVMALPKGGPGPFPCVVFLHGIGNDKELMRRLEMDVPFVEAGFAFVSFDQLTRGERKLPTRSGLARAEAFRVRAAHTVNDTRRLMDYLATRPDIATNRIYLVGASYGAITGTTAAAFDPRIRAAVLIYGGGNLSELLSASAIGDLNRRQRLLYRLLAWYFCSVFDPVRYAGRIAPRPVLFQNGRGDTVIAPSAARALQEAARAPKRILWYDGDHLDRTGESDGATLRRVLADALQFLQEVDTAVRNNNPLLPAS
ncbi:MAG: alpha/beta fold hydrolase [Verrucomicrobiales bacterium]|nr:alpha/beta fold hydrolase [Verrucomicrobiales bacterium]